jgi:hypothetical protein
VYVWVSKRERERERERCLDKIVEAKIKLRWWLELRLRLEKNGRVQRAAESII